LKEHHLPRFAVRLQQQGYAVLAYDHRGWGSSGGEPRNETNPLRQAEDYHDAVIFAGTLPGIDAKRICVWGIGHSGGAATIAAADDPNIKAVILVMPWLSGIRDASGFVAGHLAETWDERKEMCLNSTPKELTYTQVWDRNQVEAEGDRGSIVIHGPGPYEFSAGLRKLSDAAGTPWENRISLRSLYCISRSEPKDYIRRISPTPCLHLAASEDVLTGTLEEHKAAFETGGEPHEFVQLPTHHIGNYFDDGFEANIKAQIAFLNRYL
jgi:hypothetical protein